MYKVKAYVNLSVDTHVDFKQEIIFLLTFFLK